MDGACRLPCRPRNARDTIRRQSSRPVDRRLYTGRCEGLLRGTTTSYKRPTKLRQGPISGRHVPVARLSPRPRVPRGSTCRARSRGVRGGSRSLGRGERSFERSFGEPEAAQKRLERSRPGLRTRKMAGFESRPRPSPAVWRGPRGSLGRASMEIHAFRLTPGQDLKKSLLAYAKGAKLEAGCIVTCVGSLSKVRARHCLFVRGDSTLGIARGFGRLSTSPHPSLPPPPRRRAD